MDSLHGFGIDILASMLHMLSCNARYIRSKCWMHYK
jgi:hypothetical protein